MASELMPRRVRGLDGPEPPVRQARQPAADPHAHTAHHTPAATMPVIALFGPTGVGKTDVALALADALSARGENPVAISVDALQVYAGLETLTGAATAEQRERLEHRLVGIVPVTATYS